MTRLKFLVELIDLILFILLFLGLLLGLLGLLLNKQPVILLQLLNSTFSFNLLNIYDH